MQIQPLVEETLKILSIAVDYLDSLDVSKVIGQEIVKESVKKAYARVYNWVAEQFKAKNSEQVLETYTAQPTEDNKEDVEALLKIILKNEQAQHTLKQLLQEAGIQVYNTQENQEGDNEMDQNFTASTQKIDLTNKQINEKGKNVIKQNF